MASKTYSPLRYPGGKTRIFPFVSSLFVNNGIKGIDYAEPYAGGAGLALKLLIEGFVNHIYINDLDFSIYSFWYVVLNRTEEFCEWIRDVDVSIENWYYYKRIRNQKIDVDMFELAKSTLFLNRTNVSGIIKGGPIGGIQQTGKYKIHVRFNKEDLIAKIKLISQYSKNISIYNEDGIIFLKRMNCKHRDVFVYLDPPYYKKASDLYMNYFADADHEALMHFVRKLRKRWMISYDKQNFILNLYCMYHKVEYQLAQFTSNRVCNEVLIFADNIDYTAALPKLVNPVLI